MLPLDATEFMFEPSDTSLFLNDCVSIKPHLAIGSPDFVSCPSEFGDLVPFELDDVGCESDDLLLAVTIDLPLFATFCL